MAFKRIAVDTSKAVFTVHGIDDDFDGARLREVVEVLRTLPAHVVIGEDNRNGLTRTEGTALASERDGEPRAARVERRRGGALRDE